MKRSSVFNRTTLLMLALAAALALSACAPAAVDTAEPDQMHGGAPLDSAPVDTTPPVSEEETMHVSTVQVTGDETAVMVTSKGTITLEFYPDDAPNTVANFIELAESGFYDGLKFHRVIPGFMAQGGDPLTRDLTPEQVIAGAPGVGSGNPGWKQKAEFNERPHVRGTLAMARSTSVDSAGSQFYICFEPAPHLDGDYTVFGQVTEGMDVVDTIKVGDVIESVTIQR
jgi:peptidyl-prolyl cis-trans isomerase B (cyclophilin B)